MKLDRARRIAEALYRKKMIVLLHDRDTTIRSIERVIEEILRASTPPRAGKRTRTRKETRTR